MAASPEATTDVARKSSNAKSIITFLVVLVIGAGIAVAGSQGGAEYQGMPVFALLVAGIFLIQFIAFIPAWINKSEHFYDLVGGATYTLAAISAVLLSGNTDPVALALAVAVVIWAARLAPFLFRRVRRAGSDDRFDELKKNFWSFLNVWTIQGLWVTVTGGAAFAAITASERPEYGWMMMVGLGIWAIGFAIEAVADLQKSRFRANSANKGAFIHTGLWAWSRHPNYFGEITLWTGVAIAAIPALSGWQYVTLISPLFVFLLLTRISGVNLLERKADTKWGGQADYEKYKASTSVLVPLPPKR